MKPQALCIDLDGTLANITERRKLLEGDHPDWKSFYYGIPYDPVNRWCKSIIDNFAKINTVIILVSGRPDTYKQVTIEWLDEHHIYYDHLFMRKEGDFRKDNIVKEEIYEQEIKDKWDILFCVDDRTQVVQMWRSKGLVCLQCDEGNF